MNQKSIIIIVVVVVLVVLAIGGFWYWQNKKAGETVPAEEKAGVEEPAGLGAQIFESVQNPVKDRLPDTNPFSADTNPFDTPTNPFKSEYKNPFSK